MATHDHDGHSHSHAHPHGHGDSLPPEPRDADIPLVIKCSVGFLLFLFVSMGIAKVHYEVEMRRMPVAEPSPFALPPMPPGPRLQARPSTDLVKFKAEQSHAVDSYGWTDKTAGMAHIPVERAMEMVLQKGLPVRTAENEKAALAAAAAKAAATAKAKAAEAKAAEPKK